VDQLQTAPMDIATAAKYIDSFVGTCHVGCLLMSPDGETLYEKKINELNCDFCRSLIDFHDGCKSCPKAHIYGSQQAERFGGKYIYFCPSGLAFFASPITSGGSMQAALIGGPVLMFEKEEYILHDLIERNGIPREQYSLFAQELKDAFSIEPERLSQLSDMLYAVALLLAGDGERRLHEVEENIRQQALITENIQKITSAALDSTPPYPIEKEHELLSAISDGDAETAKRLLNEILGYIMFATGRKFEVVKTRILELLVLLSRAAMEGGADAEKIFGLNFIYLKEIDHFDNIEDLSFWLSRIMTRFTESVFQLSDAKHTDVIYKSVDYIKRNYMKKITLEEVATFVYLSPSYFSKIFKDELGCNFNAYLNKIRIEKSMSLLLNTSEGILRICELVGFEDQSYFSKVFKKMTGVTPGKYRETRGQTKVVLTLDKINSVK